MLADLLTVLYMTILICTIILVVILLASFFVSAIMATIKTWRKVFNDRNP